MTKNTDSLIGENIRILTNLTRYFVKNIYLPHASRHELSQIQLMILKIVGSSGSITGTEIAQSLGITRAAASQNIEYLASKNLILRQPGVGDRRRKLIILTADGHTTIDKFDQICQYKRQHVLGKFDSVEKLQFLELLQKYISSSLEVDENLKLVCLQCGEEYGKGCPQKSNSKVCEFAVIDTKNRSN